MRRKHYFFGLLAILGIAAVILFSQRKGRLEGQADFVQGQAENQAGRPSPAERQSPALEKGTPHRTANVSPLEREYSHLIAAHPSLTNVYDRLALLSLRDPFSTDLFSDACIFISLRSVMLELIDSEEREYSSMASRWSGKTNANPARVEALLRNQAKSRDRVVATYTQVLETLSKTYAERFRTRHDINGETAVAQLLALDLPPHLKMPVEMPCLDADQ